MKKKVLALFLALAMAVSLVTPAIATEPEEEPTLAETVQTLFTTLLGLYDNGEYENAGLILVALALDENGERPEDPELPETFTLPQLTEEDLDTQLQDILTEEQLEAFQTILDEEAQEEEESSIEEEPSEEEPDAGAPSSEEEPDGGEPDAAPSGEGSDAEEPAQEEESSLFASVRSSVSGEEEVTAAELTLQETFDLLAARHEAGEAGEDYTAVTDVLAALTAQAEESQEPGGEQPVVEEPIEEEPVEGEPAIPLNPVPPLDLLLPACTCGWEGAAYYHAAACPCYPANLNNKQAVLVWQKLSEQEKESAQWWFTEEQMEYIRAQEESPVEEPTEASTEANGMMFRVEGILPEGTKMQVAALETAVSEFIRSTILNLDALAEGYNGFAYDISLLKDSAEVQPDGQVRVTIQGDQFTPDSDVQVYHLPDTSAASMQAIFEDVNSSSLLDKLGDLLFGEDKPAITPEQITDVEVGDGYLTFTTDGFSVYYVVAGSNGYADWETNASELTNGETVTYYIEAGTTLTFINANNVIWTRTNGTGTYFTASGRTFTVASNAPTGTTATYSFQWREQGSNINKTATLTFIVSDHNEIIKGSIAGYPVILSVLDYSKNTGTVGSMPSEPGVTLDVKYRHIYQSGANYAVQDDRTTFSSTATGIISEDIVNALVASTDGTSTVGIYDADGSDCKLYITGIDWDKVLDVLATLNAVKATDGETLTTSNKGNYEVIPYVVKLMSATDVGWHIDCVVKPKADVTLSYDLNLKNYIATGITLPNTSVGKSPLTATVGRISGLNNNNTIDATLNGEDYNLTFLGWSTDPSAATAEYRPNASITISENTVLYAVWQGERAPGTLTITKHVTTSDTTYSAPEGAAFAFTVTFEGTSELNYTITNADGTGSSSSGTIASGGTLTLEDGQTATITNVPVGAYTVTETDAAGYTQSSTGETGSILSNQTSEAVFTNLYVKPTADLTITKAGTITDAYQSFIFDVKQNGSTITTVTIQGTGSVTIKDLPLGEYTVEERTGWSWRYSPGDSGQQVTLTATGEEVTFTNTRTKESWLTGHAFAVNNWYKDDAAKPDWRGGEEQ